MDIQKLKETANQMRADALTMIHDAGTGHTGGTMSAADIMSAAASRAQSFFFILIP